MFSWVKKLFAKPKSKRPLGIVGSCGYMYSLGSWSKEFGAVASLGAPYSLPLPVDEFDPLEQHYISQVASAHMVKGHHVIATERGGLMCWQCGVGWGWDASWAHLREEYLKAGEQIVSYIEEDDNA